VPRDFTERPQSYENNCSIKFCVSKNNTQEIFDWIEKLDKGEIKINPDWLGDGETSTKIIKHLEDLL
jgi:hypothetical protein